MNYFDSDIIRRKPYSKICFYLCSMTDYLKDTINSSSSDEDISELMKETDTLHEPIQPIQVNKLHHLLVQQLFNVLFACTDILLRTLRHVLVTVPCGY